MRHWFGCLVFAFVALSGVTTPSGEVRAQQPPSDDDGEPAADGDDEGKTSPSPYADVRADDWFTLSTPSVEIDGYFRVRTELFHNFTLGRKDSIIDPLVDAGSGPLWPQPPDNSYIGTAGDEHLVELCGTPTEPEICNNAINAGANLRLRLEPSVHVSENLHVWSQIDVLDNIVLGSHPQGYANVPSADGGYRVVARGGYSPLGAFAATQWAPASGVNATGDSIAVKRVWGSYMSPIGKLSFGRMPHHWGLGMVNNAGDSYDSDWQSTVDRLTFTYAVEDWNLYLTGAWDFANEGPSSSQLHAEQGAFGAGTYEQGGQPYDMARSDDLDQWVFTIVHKVEPQLARYQLAKGRPVVNAGAYFAYRTQDLAQESTDSDTAAAIGQAPSDISGGLVRRGYESVVGDVWVQLLYDKLRFEAEAAWAYGTLDNTLREDDSDFDNLIDPAADGWTISQFGLATETEWRAVEDRLRLNFGFGFATGDGDVAGLEPTQTASSGSSLERQLTLDRTYTTFRFHPDYRVDMILFRNILTRVQGAYYFRPSVEYDFMRDPEGQRAGAEAAVIWSRASERVQAPGNHPDLGLELNLKMYYQLSDGVVSDDVEQMGGFYTAVEYGVLFPLPGLDYLPGEVTGYANSHPRADALDVGPAQMARWYLGVMF